MRMFRRNKNDLDLRDPKKGPLAHMMKDQIDRDNEYIFKLMQIENAKKQSKWNIATFIVAFLTLVIYLSALIISLI
mgnify:CR=1 FL=1